MIKSVLFREDTVYKAFPDLAMCDDGSLVCIYRESLFHGARPFSRLVAHISRDGGLNWGKKQVIHELADYEKEGGLNNPRILYLGGKQLLLICDWIPAHEPEYTLNSKTFLWRSEDGGVTWGGKTATGITGHICPCIVKMKSAAIIIGADGFDEARKAWTHDAYLSTDSGRSWNGPTEVSSSPRLWLNEGTYVELDDGTLVCYMREDNERACAYKALSKDGGKTWAGPYPTHLLACVGRPHARLLRSGEVAITYGFSTSPRQLVLHVEDQSTASDPQCAQREKRSHLEPIYRRFFIDHDRSIYPDGAYSGWVQLPNGDMYIVQYIVDDAPFAHIRSYLVGRSDWILCPEGEITRIDRRENALYHELAIKASEAQFRKAYRKW